MSPYSEERGSDSLTPEEWSALRLADLRSRVYSTADLDKIPPPDPLVDGWVWRGSMCWLFGKRSSMKSFAALDMAGCVGGGLDWHGYPTKQSTVLYAALEGGSGFAQRVRAWEDRYGLPMTGVHFLVPPLLHIVSDAAVVAGLIEGVGAGLLILDTQNRATSGLEENSSVDMGLMIGALDSICHRTGAGILVVHHTSDGFRPRGHSSIDGAAQSMIRVARDGALVKISNDKQKDGPQGRPLILAATRRLESLVLEPENGIPAPTDSGRTILSALANLQDLNGGATFTELKRSCSASGMPESTFAWALRRLVQSGAVAKGAGRSDPYRIIPPAQGTQSALDGEDGQG